MWRHCYGFSKRRHQVGISSISPIIFATGVISLGPLGALVFLLFWTKKCQLQVEANSLNHRNNYLLLVSSASFIYLFHLYTCFIYLFINGTSNIFYWDPNENWHDTHSKLTHHLQAKVRMFPSLEVVLILTILDQSSQCCSLNPTRFSMAKSHLPPARQVHREARPEPGDIGDMTINPISNGELIWLLIIH